MDKQETMREPIERNLLNLTACQLERFWKYVDITDSCWNWTASTNQKGYGRMSLNRKSVQTHRLVYELLIGKIPEGLTIDHLCRNRKCVNPDHLEPVTNRENVMRGKGVCSNFAKQTHCIHGHPLTEDNIYPDQNRRQCISQMGH